MITLSAPKPKPPVIENYGENMTLAQKLNDPYFYETPLPRVALIKPKQKDMINISKKIELR